MLFSARGQPLELPKVHETVFRRLEKELQSESNNYTNLSEKIPKQLSKGRVHELIDEALTYVAESSKIALIGNCLLNFLQKGTLS